ncbi:MAG: hypothetical protein ACRKFN_11175 [Desulfitobacterium sp.]
MLPISYGENSSWFRFSNYDTYETKKGVYIIPSPNAARIVYNPYDLVNKLIDDYLQFGYQLFKGLDGHEKTNGALRLVRKYGLLGILTSSKYRMLLLDPKQTIALSYDDGEFIGEKTLDEYLSDFFPVYDRQPPKEIIQAEQYMQFDSNYSEQVGWIARKAYDLYYNLKNIKDFEKTKEIENLSDGDYIHKVISSRYHIKNIDLMIQYDEDKGVTLNWEAHNLYKMIDILYALKLIDKKTGLETCEYCGDPFLKRRRDMKYCTEECGNSSRVRKSIVNKQKNKPPKETIE